ncbi:MAG: hypothetical protein MZV49_11415 [Rhodopseudomonas palustris]|nr:hypothetical protein [Rhodopseudomonas palustris]
MIICFWEGLEDPTGTNLWGKQFVANDGGFTIYSPQFSTSEWLAAINTSIAIPYLPGILNFHIYGNIAYIGSPDDFQTYNNSDKLAWECGIQYRIANKAVVISLPLFMSKQLEDYIVTMFMAITLSVYDLVST